MPRKYPRSVVSSYQLDSDPPKQDPVNLGTELAEGDDSNYDPNAYYLRATDRHGHCKNIQVTIPTTFSAAIHQIVESGTNPYRSAVDLARDGLVHIIARRLKELGTADDEGFSGWMAIENLERIRHEAEYQINYLNTISETCETLVVTEDWHKLQQILYEAENAPLPRGLRIRRDTLVNDLRSRIPQSYHWSYDVQ